MKKLEIKVKEHFLDSIEFWQYDYYMQGYNRYWDTALNIQGTKLFENNFKCEALNT